MAEFDLPDVALDILGYWFETLAREQWFMKDSVIDGEIARRFKPFYEETRASNYADLEAWLANPSGALAAVILLDQFPRNLFRGSPRSFESDEAARHIADRAIALGYDMQISVIERSFLYLPFEHSEDLADQERSCALMQRTNDGEYVKYAEAHHAIIRRFGRFPHRNEVLGRASTEEEIAFLKEPGSSF